MEAGWGALCKTASWVRLHEFGRKGSGNRIGVVKRVNRVGCAVMAGRSGGGRWWAAGMLGGWSGGETIIVARASSVECETGAACCWHSTFG